MKFAVQLFLGALICVIGKAHAGAPCAGKTLSKDGTVRLQTRLFDALAHDDRGAWDLLVAPDFRAFERGQQYDDKSFFGLIANAHKKGIQLNWAVTEPNVEADCRLAVMSYVNVGSITEPGAEPKPQRWLETVAFRRDGSTWRAVLVTSMRADDVSPMSSQTQ